MRLLFLGNNRVACHLLEWLRDQGEEIAGLVLHPESKRRYGDELRAVVPLEDSQVFDGSRLEDPKVLGSIESLRADLAISVYFGYILKANFLRLFPQGCINLHPALLPYNRGAYPNVWSIIDGTPAGVTLHYVDLGIDTGDIIAQREVEVEPVDTGATLYGKLEEACIGLFVETWPLIKAGQAKRLKQAEAGTAHRLRDVERIDEIQLDQSFTGRALLNILRARTFPPHRGAYFIDRGRRVYVSVQLQYGDQP